MKCNYIILLVAFFITTAINAQQKNNIEAITVNPFTIGEIAVIQSNILNEERTINIYLPAGYTINNQKEYPVIYLLDGSANEDFIHISGIVQFGSFPWIEMLPESIVIGIANVDRKRDFTFPTKNVKDKIDFPTTGESAKFIRFLEEELQPFVEKNYSASSTKTIIGQSLGGLLATEILFKKPDLFTNYIIISPSLWWDDESLLNVNPERNTKNKHIYLSVGKEGETMERIANVLAEKLVLTYPKTTNIDFEFFEDFEHGNILHISVYNAFERIFKNK